MCFVKTDFKTENSTEGSLSACATYTWYGLVAGGWFCALSRTIVVTVVTETTSEAAAIQTITVIYQRRPILMVSLVLPSRRLPILDQTQQARMSHDWQLIQVDRTWELDMVSHHLMVSLYNCTNVTTDLSWRQSHWRVALIVFFVQVKEVSKIHWHPIWNRFSDCDIEPLGVVDGQDERPI